MQADWSHYVESVYYPELFAEAAQSVTFTALPARAKGFDTSYWNHGPEGAQKPIDFQAAYDAGYRFWIGRLTRGSNYIDTWIERDYQAASRTPLIRCVYHVLYPGEPVGRHTDNLKLGLGLLDEPPKAIGLDLERGAEFGAAAVTKCLVDTMLYVNRWWNGKLLLYSNDNYLKNYIRDRCGLDLWLADPDNNDDLALYNPVILQSSWVTPIPGVPDATVDFDEFMGDEVQLCQYFLDESEPEPEEPMPNLDTLKAILTDLQNTADTLEGDMRALNNYIVEAEGQPQPPTPPTPPPPAPPNVKTYKVKPFEGDPKAPARFISYWNVNKKGVKVPVFAIYPSDSSKSDERQIFKLGETVQIEGGELKGDGGLVCLKLYDPEERYKFQPLYMRLLDLEG